MTVEEPQPSPTKVATAVDELPPVLAKVPTAVTVVGFVGLAAMLASGAYGGYLLVSLWQEGLLAMGRITWVAGGDVTPEASHLLTGVYYVLAALVMAVILLGFVRLRRWAWAALMLWCGLNLAVGLARYFEQGGQLRLYITMLTSALVVLILNLDVVQTTFGLRRVAHERPIRTTETPSQDA